VRAIGGSLPWCRLTAWLSCCHFCEITDGWKCEHMNRAPFDPGRPEEEEPLQRRFKAVRWNGWRGVPAHMRVRF